MSAGVSDRPEAEGLSARTVRGVFWSGASQTVIQGISFAVGIVVARLLFPDDFGILGMAGMFIELVSLVSDLGLNAALVQRKAISQTQLTTCFYINLIVSAGLIALSILCAPLAAALFEREIVGPVIMVASLGFLFRAAGSVHRSLLTRDMAFRTLAIPDIAGIVAFGAAVIPMALTGFGLWSVVIANLISGLVSTTLLWLYSPWRPGWAFDWRACRDMITFGLNVLGEQALDYVNLNIDYLLIGRMLGASALGGYTLAFNLMTFPLRKITQMVSRVTFPAFSQVQEDPGVLRNGYLKTVRYIALITFPALTGLGILAPDVIQLVYTDKWAAAIFPLQIMCIDGLVRTISSTTGSILYARGRADLGFKWKLVTVCVIPPAVVVGTQYGIVGVSIAVALCTLILAPIIQIITHRLIELPARPFLSALAPAFWCSIVMGLSLTGLSRMRFVFWPDADYLFLGGAIVAGAVVYSLFFRLLFRKTFFELTGLIRSLRG